MSPLQPAVATVNVGVQTDGLSLISSATQTMKPHNYCANAVEMAGNRPAGVAAGDMEMCSDLHGFLYWDED
jgi:hypothetical protein